MTVLGGYIGGGPAFSVGEVEDVQLESDQLGVAPVREFFTGTSYNAFLDYYNGVARAAGIDGGNDPKEILGRLLQAGWIPIYCSDSVGTRDDIYDQFKKLGWTGTRWGQRYAKGGGSYSWWYGVHFKLADAPTALVDKAKRDACGRDLAARLQQTLDVLTNAKGKMKTYGGNVSKTDPTSFETLALLAVPISPEMCNTVQPPAATSAFGPQGRVLTEPLKTSGGVVPWYKKWWVWALIVGGTATAGVGGYLIYRRYRRGA